MTKLEKAIILILTSPILLLFLPVVIGYLHINRIYDRGVDNGSWVVIHGMATGVFQFLYILTLLKIVY